MIHKDKDPSLKTYLLQVGLNDLGFESGPEDNWYGAKTDAAYKKFLAAMVNVYSVKASSFADPEDVQAFRACKALGNSDEYCFKFGDNGIGYFTGMDCSVSTSNICALPREDWMERWGTKENAALRPVLVTYRGKEVLGVLGDTMPHKANITNGAGIDLNPGFAKAFGLRPPFLLEGFTWSWA